MTPAAILALVVQYGPEILPLVQQLVKWVKENKTEVTPEDIALLISYGSKTSAQYLAEAKGTPSA